ncbi:hypothetical protein ABXN37_26950 [Piscinibacter sakaiensis]|uniref:Uncharacterized protein n=1 Tax=Piscinibacter sakaiensis TaxID=1547922 RepID=A0A0K8P7V9_PISS1|nr:hypothetical protein [Piscinibacter sakaiensis]GAP38738.1 hypothetical protein ISF6_5291 [Piscinibacter sakaiensis]
MNVAERIRQLGFRKWYKRELLSGHAHLVLTLCCVVGVFAAFEAYHEVQPTSERMIDVLSILVCAAVGLWSIRRYLYLLMHAESLANQAVCRRCDAYARFDIEQVGGNGRWLRLRCRQCGNGWTMED